ARRLGLKTVVTMHLPANICMRGTMLYEGRSACDGHIEPERCASCWLQSKGLPTRAAKRIAKLPCALRSLARLPRVGSMLNAKDLAKTRKKELDQMAAISDRIVVPCGWLRGALLNNGLVPKNIVLNRQGVGYHLDDMIVSRD